MTQSRRRTTLDLAAWRTYELGNLRARREYATRRAAEEPARCLGRDCRRHARTNGGLCLKCHSEEQG